MLFAYVDEEDWIVGFEDVEALRASYLKGKIQKRSKGNENSEFYLLHGRAAHSHCKMDQFLLGSLAVEHKFIRAANTTKK